MKNLLPILVILFLWCYGNRRQDNRPPPLKTVVQAVQNTTESVRVYKTEFVHWLHKTRGQVKPTPEALVCHE